MIISLPLIIIAIIEGDTVFVSDSQTQSDYNVSADTMKHKGLQINYRNKG